MKLTSATPGLLLLAVTLLCVLVSAFTFSAATGVPRLGLKLAAGLEGVVVTGVEPGARFDVPGIAPGSQLLAIGAVPVIPEDITPEPDSLESYAALDAFYARQSALNAVLHAERIDLVLRNSGADYTIIGYPHRAPWWGLPDGFWAQYLTGIAGMLIAGWVWALRPNKLGPIMFAISAIGLVMSTTTSSIYANRELAISGADFAAMMPVNHAGALLFGIAMIGLFLCYPHQLVRPRWLLLLPVFLALAMLLDINEIGIGPSQLYLFVALETLAILAAIGAQWWSTRRTPSDRAALGWLGLSVAIGVGAYTILGAAPVLLDVPFGLPQSHVTGVLVVIYAGLALGLSRYRLFELGDWAYRVLFYTIGAVLLLLIDGALIFLLNMDVAPALGVALLLVGFIYLPTRDWIWRRLTARHRIEQHELFSVALDVAFAPSAAQRAARWRALLQRLFDPLEISEEAPGPTQPRATADGLTLVVPAVVGAPALRLHYPFAGRGLFNPDHLQLATQLVALTERAEEGRDAYTRGAGEERRRMARDLHDDVGARLLTGLHTADAATRPTLQAALSDIRAIVSGLSGDEASLDRVLAETRHETARRLEAANIALDWPVSDNLGDAVQLDYRRHKALTSSVREIVSNVIRHAGARNLVVTLDLTPDLLTLHFADDGAGLAPSAMAGEGPGYGLRNLRHRIEDVGGSLTLANSGNGTTIGIAVPLHAAAALTPDRGLNTGPERLSSAS